MYVLEVFNTDLRQLGLHKAVRVTCFGINIAILELYCPVSGTFFTAVGELGMVLHEM